MSDWGEGYVTEVSYAYRYQQQLLPRLLSFATLSRGVAAPGGGSEKLRVLELGCGQGVSANIIAAANPELDYTAIDFNPEHISGAQAVAVAAGTPNVHFVETSFEDVANDRSTGFFDVITLHGIYSWVSAANREHIVRIAREKLRTGGMLHLSYNTYPGWATVEPIRRMFRDVASDNPNAPIFDRLDEGFRLFDLLANLKSQYIESVPNLVSRVQYFKKDDRKYVAHELLNEERTTTFHFADVVADMARAKLSYVGSAFLWDHLDGLHLTDEQREFLATIRNPIRRESFRDLIVNQHFRRDIFAKGALPISGPRLEEAWSNLRFGLSTSAANVPRASEGAKLPGEYHAIHEHVLEKLDSGPRSGRELLNGLEMDAASPAFRRVMIWLVGQGNCHVVPPEDNEAERNQRTEALNRVILNNLNGIHDWNNLASPVLGEAVGVDVVTQLMLLSAREKSADAVGFIWNGLKSRGNKVVKDGKPLDSEEENLAELRRIEAKIQGVVRELAALKVY
jgi:SAM-dependent methyltransferase